MKLKIFFIVFKRAIIWWKNKKLMKKSGHKLSAFFPCTCRSSHHRSSVKKLFLEILQNSWGNTCVRVSFLIKLQVSATLLKKRLRYFPVSFVKFIRTTFSIEHHCWLLLYIRSNIWSYTTSLFISLIWTIKQTQRIWKAKVTMWNKSKNSLWNQLQQLS